MLIGRRLSYLLRHAPANAKYRMDESGWVSIQEILPFIGQTITEETLQEVVQKDTKGRFAIHENGLYIRACQGHTIALKAPILRELTYQDVGLIALHATTHESWKIIQEGGYLSKMNRTHIHFATSSNQMRQRPVHLRLLIKETLDAGIKIYISSNNVVLIADPLPIHLVSIE